MNDLPSALLVVLRRLICSPLGDVCRTLVLGWAGVLATMTVATASGPADELFRLVPADSGVTLSVEDLRGQSKLIRESAFFDGLSRLEVVRSWLGSDRLGMFHRATREIQANFGISLEVIRDDLLGDAVIFALQPGPASKPDQAQGLLLVRPRDRDLVARLLNTLNQIQTRAGELDRVEPRSRGASTYMVRQFKGGQRPAEFYIVLDNGTFAWSNSEAVIQGVIDRKTTTGTGLGDDLRFQKVRKGLPERSLVSLFVNPRLIERLMTDASSKDSPERLPMILARYFSAVAQLGFAVQWRDGFEFHSHEVLSPEKLDPWLKRWLTRAPSAADPIASVPDSAVAMIAADLDFEALGEAARELIPEADQASFANLKIAAQGLLLGHDPMTWVFPRLNRGLMVYLDIEPSPKTRPAFPWVAVVGWSNPSGLDELAGPIDNALRTLFAMVAVDPKYRDARMKIETQGVGESRLTSLTQGDQAVIAYRTERDRVVVGNSTAAIARVSAGTSNTTLGEIRSKYVPDARTFAVVDVQRLATEARRLREPIAKKLAARSHRSVDATVRDLDQLVDLASLFRAFTFSTITAKDATEIHRTMGFFAR